MMNEECSPVSVLGYSFPLTLSLAVERPEEAPAPVPQKPEESTRRSRDEDSPDCLGRTDKVPDSLPSRLAGEGWLAWLYLLTLRKVSTFFI